MPWEKKKVSTLWDNEGLGEGIYDVEIIVLYEEKTTKISGKIEIMREPEPKEEISLKKYLTVTNMLIAAAAVLIVINIIILLKRRKREEKGKK